MLVVGATTMVPIKQNSFASPGNTTATTPIAGILVILNCLTCINITFTTTVISNNPQPSSFPLYHDGAQLVKLGPGSFAVSIVASMNQSYSKDCKGTISAGQALTFNITLKPSQ